jgi:hypothetical protein
VNNFGTSTHPAAYTAAKPTRHLPRHGPCVVRVRGPQRRPDQRLRRDGERVEQQRGELPQLQPDLVRGDLRRAHAGRDTRRCQERDLEGSRTQDEIAPDEDLRTHDGPVRPQVGRGSPQRAQEQSATDYLSTDVRDRGTFEPHADRVDQHWRRRRRECVGGEHDPHGLTRALDAAHPAVAGEYEQNAGHAEHGDAEPRLCCVLGGGRTGEQPGERTGQRLAEGDDREPDAQSEPGRLHALVDRGVLASGAVPARRPRGGAVLDERPDDRQQCHECGGDAEPGERARAEMPDDGGVDEQVERLGGQHYERGAGEREEAARGVRAGVGTQVSGVAEVITQCPLR